MEIPFEYMLATLESERLTPEATPARYLNLAGTITPRKERSRPPESRGTLAEYYRSVTVRRWADWEGEGPLDVYTLPLLLNALVAGGISGGPPQVTTPPGATTTRLWTFAPTMTADDLESLTMWWGDPSVQVWRAGGCMPDEVTITSDASGTDTVMLSASGMGLAPEKVAAPTAPAMLNGPLLMPTAMQLWIDSGVIGTTPIVGRLSSASITVPSAVTRKWLAQGPESDLSFGKIGRGLRHVELNLVMEVPDMVQYDQWEAETVLKTRLRLNGPRIEAGFYHYLELDIYGPMDAMNWAESEGSNRTIELTILSEFDAVAGYDWRMRVQTDRATL